MTDTIVSQSDAKYAAGMIQGIVSHPFWKGIDRDALQRVIDALNDGTIKVEEDE